LPQQGPPPEEERPGRTVLPFEVPESKPPQRAKAPPAEPRVERPPPETVTSHEPKPESPKPETPKPESPKPKPESPKPKSEVPTEEHLRVSVKSSVRDPDLLLVRVLRKGQAPAAGCHEAFLSPAQDGVDLRSIRQ
jgi:hypothetical protein